MPRATRKKAAPAPTPAAKLWGWWLVEAVCTDAGRRRTAGSLYPWWWVRLHSKIGTTVVESQWRVLDLPCDSPLRVLVRAPAWALGLHAGVGLTASPQQYPATVTHLGDRDPRPKVADLDHPLYNIETVNL